MLFSSPTFLFVFLPISLAVYYASGRSKLAFLATSLIFYAWGEPVFVALLLTSALLNWFLGAIVGRAKSPKPRTLVLVLGIIYNISVLVFFKYLDFIIGNVNLILSNIWAVEMPSVDVTLPLGVSFFTFHAISYLVDVYRRDIALEKSPVNFALYISMFPHLIAGPIVRFGHIAADLRDPKTSWTDFAEGARRFTIGVAKKVIIADTLAIPADQIFSIPYDHLSFATTTFGVVLFTFQIYFDFSGYSDMAIGLARMFGYRFHENFDLPYASRSIREFWRRWHISLSTWFRDYVYRPLGGNRRGHFRTLFNLFLVFVLCGFWHGATWTFFLWGVYQGAFLVLERTSFGWLLEKLPPISQHAYTMAVVILGWTIFRAHDLEQLRAFMSCFIGAHGLNDAVYPIVRYADRFTLIVLAMGVICSIDLRPAAVCLHRVVSKSAVACRVPVLISSASVGILAMLLVLSASVIATNTHRAFIYFRF
jgi:alginate O-acetyltransferase complex protein AlgI